MELLEQILHALHLATHTENVITCIYLCKTSSRNNIKQSFNMQSKRKPRKSNYFETNSAVKVQVATRLRSALARGQANRNIKLLIELHNEQFVSAIDTVQYSPQLSVQGLFRGLTQKGIAFCTLVLFFEESIYAYITPKHFDVIS